VNQLLQIPEYQQPTKLQMRQGWLRLAGKKSQILTQRMNRQGFLLQTTLSYQMHYQSRSQKRCLVQE
jgi:hypothetical protein